MKIKEIEKRTAAIRAELNEYDPDNEAGILTAAREHVQEIDFLLATLKEENHKIEIAMKAIEDMCETDMNVRNLLCPYMDVDGNRDGVPGLEDLTEKIVAALKEKDKRIAKVTAERDETIREWQDVRRDCQTEKG